MPLKGKTQLEDDLWLETTQCTKILKSVCLTTEQCRTCYVEAENCPWRIFRHTLLPVSLLWIVVRKSILVRERERKSICPMSYVQSLILANGMHWLTAAEIDMKHIILSSLNFCDFKTGTFNDFGVQSSLIFLFYYSQSDLLRYFVRPLCIMFHYVHLNNEHIYM